MGMIRFSEATDDEWRNRYPYVLDTGKVIDLNEAIRWAKVAGRKNLKSNPQAQESESLGKASRQVMVKRRTVIVL